MTSCAAVPCRDSRIFILNYIIYHSIEEPPVTIQQAREETVNAPTQTLPVRRYIYVHSMLNTSTLGAVRRAVLAIVDGDFVVYITSAEQSGGGGTVAVFVKRHDDGAAPCQLDSVGRAGLMVVLITVEQQNAGRGAVLCCGIGRIELIGEPPRVRINDAVGDIYSAPSVCMPLAMIIAANITTRSTASTAADFFGFPFKLFSPFGVV